MSKMSAFSSVSGIMGSFIGNLMSPLSALKQIHADGPALSHSLLRASKAAPSMLLGPVIGNPLASAMHGQINSGTQQVYLVV